MVDYYFIKEEVVMGNPHHGPDTNDSGGLQRKSPLRVRKTYVSMNDLKLGPSISNHPNQDTI